MKESSRIKKNKVNYISRKSKFCLKMTTLGLSGFRICQNDRKSALNSILLERSFDTSDK